MRMTTTRAILGPVLVLTSIACAPTRESAERDLQSRASHELSCPVEKLVFTPMSSDTVVYDGNATDTPKNMGVSGCGRNARYVWVKDKGYVMNDNTTTTVTAN